jgi:hypothetical protein
MSNSVPKHCTNPACHEPTIKAIHRTSRRAAIDAVDGAGVYAELVTYRCTKCGHTWGVSGYATEGAGVPAPTPEFVVRAEAARIRGW